MTSSTREVQTGDVVEVLCMVHNGTFVQEVWRMGMVVRPPDRNGSIGVRFINGPNQDRMVERSMVERGNWR